MLPKNGGVVMVTFVPGFLSPKVNALEQGADGRAGSPEGGSSRTIAAAVKAARRRVDGSATRRRAPRSRRWPTTSITSARSRASITSASAATSTASHRSVLELEDVSKYPGLTAELLRRGYTDEDIKKILGLNILRVMREAEKVSKRLQAERGPSTAVFQPSK